MKPFLFCLSLVAAFAALAAGAADTATPKSFKGPVGLELYSLRAEFAKDIPGTLDRVRRYGIKYVELAGTYTLAPGQFKELLEARGLKAISGHFPYERFRDDV